MKRYKKNRAEVEAGQDSKDESSRDGTRRKENGRNEQFGVGSSPILLPVALLLPGLVRVETSIRVALGVADVTLRSLALRLVLLLSRTLRTRSTSTREPLSVVETTLRLLHTATTLWALAGLSYTSSTYVLDVGTVRLVRGLGRAPSALTEGRTRGGTGSLPEADKALDTLAAATVELLAVIVGRQGTDALAVCVLVVDISVGARRVLLSVQALTVR